MGGTRIFIDNNNVYPFACILFTFSFMMFYPQYKEHVEHNNKLFFILISGLTTDFIHLQNNLNVYSQPITFCLNPAPLNTSNLIKTKAGTSLISSLYSLYYNFIGFIFNEKINQSTNPGI